LEGAGEMEFLSDIFIRSWRGLFACGEVGKSIRRSTFPRSQNILDLAQPRHFMFSEIFARGNDCIAMNPL
jgi:hypothetical protein